MKDKREVMMMTMITSNQGQGVDGGDKGRKAKDASDILANPECSDNY